MADKNEGTAERTIRTDNEIFLSCTYLDSLLVISHFIHNLRRDCNALQTKKSCQNDCCKAISNVTKYSNNFWQAFFFFFMSVPFEWKLTSLIIKYSESLFSRRLSSKRKSCSSFEQIMKLKFWRGINNMQHSEN